MTARRTRCGAHVAAVLAVVLQPVTGAGQGPPSRILPVYRDLLDASPAIAAEHDRSCGFGTGPFQVLQAPMPGAGEIVRALDAARVTDRAAEALARVSTILPGADVTICLYPGELSGGLPHLGGVGGVSLGNGQIKLFLHPGPKRLERIVYTVAHEYHHEAERVLGPGGFSPIDILIREGKADYFAVTLYPDLRPAHTQTLSTSELTSAWSDLLEYERSPSPTFRRDFMIGAFGPGVKGIRWPGYRLGYQMVEYYMRGRRATPREWIGIPAAEIRARFERDAIARLPRPEATPRQRIRSRSAHQAR